MTHNRTEVQTRGSPYETVSARSGENIECATQLDGVAHNCDVCVTQSAMPYSHSGIIRASNGSVFERFQVDVQWSNGAIRGDKLSYCAAECGEYHQFVKGYMLASSNVDGSDAKDVSGRIFGGVPLYRNVFHEDGRDNNPKARYGHRKEPVTMNEELSDPVDRLTGKHYVGRDEPACTSARTRISI